MAVSFATEDFCPCTFMLYDDQLDIHRRSPGVCLCSLAVREIEAVGFRFEDCLLERPREFEPVHKCCCHVGSIDAQINPHVIAFPDLHPVVPVCVIWLWPVEYLSRYISMFACFLCCRLWKGFCFFPPKRYTSHIRLFTWSHFKVANGPRANETESTAVDSSLDV